MIESNYQKSSHTLQGLFVDLYAVVILLSESFVADQTFAIEPVVAVLKVATALACSLVLLVAFGTFVSLVLSAPVDLARSSFQFVMGEAV